MRLDSSKDKALKESTKSPLVSVVVLNWHGTDDTLRCIDSLRGSAYKNIELVIVDNEWSTDSKAQLESFDFSAPVRYIANDDNLGFTGGEIAALSQCAGEFILLLNNDAALDSRAISQAINTIGADSKIAVVGGRSYGLDEDWNKNAAHFYTHQRVDPITAEVTTYEKDENIVQEVSNISGACVLIRRSAIEDTGYFDDSFFAYYEETDLFSRLRRQGWKIVYDPGVIVWHKHGASTKNKKYMYHYFMLRNQFRFAYKNFDKRSLKLFKRVYWRNFRRSLKVYVKHRGHTPAHDAVHKARVTSTLNNLLARPKLAIRRHTVQRVNSSFSINDELYKDNPLPVSLLIDATGISGSQATIVSQNLQSIAEQTLRPAEVIVVSKRSLKIPETSSLVRIENIVDKEIFDMTAMDYFMMTSNFDVLVFGAEKLTQERLSADDSLAISGSLRDIYESMTAGELAGIVGIEEGATGKRLSRKAFLDKPFQIFAVKKTYMVHYLTDNSHITKLSNSVLADVLGESLSQCREITLFPYAHDYLGILKGEINSDAYPILTKPFKYTVKRLAVSLHIMILIVIAQALFWRALRVHTPMQDDQNSSSEAAPIVYSREIPVIINTRDRFDPLMKLVAWLESIGHTRIMFVDNDSAYPPLLDYFQNCDYQVVRLGRNAMHKAPWESFGVRFAAKESAYIVSDPDVIPDPSCPNDAVEYFVGLLNKYPAINKVGFGLRIDDLPDAFIHKKRVVEWESRFWDESLLLEPGVYKADLDTTFAVYRAYTWWFLSPSIRTGMPYVVAHEPWYQDFDNPTDDFIFYTTRANNAVSTWSFKKLPKHHLRALKKEGYMTDFDEKEEE